MKYFGKINFSPSPFLDFNTEKRTYIVAICQPELNLYYILCFNKQNYLFDAKKLALFTCTRPTPPASGHMLMRV